MIMKTILLCLGFLMISAFASAGSEVNHIEISHNESLNTLIKCTVTVTKMCDGVGNVSHSSTSYIGNCDDAYTAANEGWSGACLEALILHEIKKAMEDDASGNN